MGAGVRDAFPPPMCVWIVYAFRLGGLRMDGFVCWLVKTVHMNQHHRCCTFVSPGLPTKGGYPGENRGGEPMPSALYFLKSIFVWEIICRVW